MKKILKGFSLAELLIAMGIVSIVAIMAMNISQKGMERAYNIYYYTGYSNLCAIILEAMNDNMIPKGGLNTIDTQNFLGYIAGDEGFEASCKDESDGSSNACTVHTGSPDFVEIRETSNGIIYDIEYSGKFETPQNVTNVEQINSDAYIISMTVPTPRKKSGDSVVVGNTVRFLYLTNFENGLIIPLFTNGIRPSTLADKETTEFVNLQDRKDLLPFYLDGGDQGKVIYEWNEGTGHRENTPRDFKNRDFMSFREAYCKKYKTLLNNNVMYVNCSSPTLIQQSTDLDVLNSAITFEDPRKVF